MKTYLSKGTAFDVNDDDDEKDRFKFDKSHFLVGSRVKAEEGLIAC